MIKFVLALAMVVCVYASSVPEKPHKATVLLKGAVVSGKVIFTQTGNDLVLEGEIKGLTPGKHGFHIHELGDLSEECKSTGGHFNPEKKNHGAPEAKERHVGDLGNVVADENGVAKVDIKDSIASLLGPHSVVGRAVVVHEGEDDLGLTGVNDSLTTGNAGGRVACGIIGIL